MGIINIELQLLSSQDMYYNNRDRKRTTKQALVQSLIITKLTIKSTINAIIIAGRQIVQLVHEKKTSCAVKGIHSCAISREAKMLNRRLLRKIDSADDCLLYRVIRSVADCITLQNDLQQLMNWSDKWLMKFNIDKCQSMSVHSAFQVL